MEWPKSARSRAAGWSFFCQQSLIEGELTYPEGSNTADGHPMMVNALKQRLFVSSRCLTDELQRDFHPQELMHEPSQRAGLIKELKAFALKKYF
jgi:hypothetical protein